MPVQRQAELRKSVDPRPVGDVGNTIIAYEIVAIAQSVIDHAKKTHGLALVALDGERNLLGCKNFEVPELTQHRTDVPNLEEQPLQQRSQTTFTSTRWIAFLHPNSGWVRPPTAWALEHSTTSPGPVARQERTNRCQARSARGSTCASVHVAPPSTLTSTRWIPRSAHAHPQSSCGLSRLSVCPGAGATMMDSGATDQTGTLFPESSPPALRIGSLYQRVVKGPGARLSTRVIRVSHLTLLVSSIKTRDNEAGRETVFWRQSAAIHFIGDQDISLNARNRKILEIGIDDNAAEFTKIRAVRPNVLSGRARPAIGQDVGEPDATPPDVANASRRLERREGTSAALMSTCHLGRWIPR